MKLLQSETMAPAVQKSSSVDRSHSAKWSSGGCLSLRRIRSTSCAVEMVIIGRWHGAAKTVIIRKKFHRICANQSFSMFKLSVWAKLKKNTIGPILKLCPFYGMSLQIQRKSKKCHRVFFAVIIRRHISSELRLWVMTLCDVTMKFILTFASVTYFSLTNFRDWA